jgi:hypothetical protein
MSLTKLSLGGEFSFIYIWEERYAATKLLTIPYPVGLVKFNWVELFTF